MQVIKDDIFALFKAHGCHAANVFSFEETDESVILKKDVPAFQYWLSQYAHGGMLFLEKNLEARKKPNHILENVKSAIVFLFPYALGHRTRGGTPVPQNDKIQYISRYAQGKDYHKVLKKKLENIAHALQEAWHENFAFRTVVDSVPFFDRAHAREAQLGFIGKNTMLIRPGMGSFFFIATLLVDFPYTKIAYQNEKINPITNLDCGTCTKCIDACPTQAITSPYFLNANNCLSYLSIEHRDLVPDKFVQHFEKTIYGCDICQEVCPYNFVTTHFEILKEFSSRDRNSKSNFSTITPKEIALMTQFQYEQWFAGTAVTRGKYQGLVRNALYHLHAVGHPELANILNSVESSQAVVGQNLILRTIKQIKSLEEQKLKKKVSSEVHNEVCK